jgi:predicted transcriptional regulator
VDEAVRERAIEEVRIGEPGRGISPEPKRAGDTVIMDILDDQNPHSLSELASHANVPVWKVKAFINFLTKYALVTYDEQKQIAVICHDFVLL